MFIRRSWQEELDIIDQTMKAISDVSDPEKLVDVYWRGIDRILPVHDYVAMSRRNVEPPYYLITRSSRFTEHFNPWTQRDRLPRLTGGLLGEIAYANKPVIIEDLPARLAPDDPSRFYIEGFGSLIAFPQYDGGQALNVTVMLLPPGMAIDHASIPIMHWQSGLFGRGTQNLVLRNQLRDALGALDRELQVVGEIQRSLLPSELPSISDYDIAAHYHTSARAGGDYYDFFSLQDSGWGIFLADVSGHGAPAAVLMAITHAIAHAKPQAHAPPAVQLSYLNTRLARAYTRDGSFITAFYAVLDPAKRTLTYSRAGHNPPRLVRGGRVIALNGDGALPMGILDNQEFHESTLQLERGDLLLLYTDGITEAAPPVPAGAQRDLFGVERLDSLLLEDPGQSAARCLAKIRERVGAFCNGAPATDDQTLIAIRCL